MKNIIFLSIILLSAQGLMAQNETMDRRLTSEFEKDYTMGIELIAKVRDRHSEQIREIKISSMTALESDNNSMTESDTRALSARLIEENLAKALAAMDLNLVSYSFGSFDPLSTPYNLKIKVDPNRIELKFNNGGNTLYQESRNTKDYIRD